MKRMKLIIIAFIILELIALLCMVFKIPFNPYGYYWLFFSSIVLGFEGYEVFFRKSIK